MPRSFETNFVYNFKRGDNIALNVQSLNKLWVLRNELPTYEKWLLNKPVVLAIASIVEACLCEIFYRIRRHTVEGVPHLTAQQVKGVRSTARDNFSLYIKISRQNSLLGAPAKTDIYDRLEKFRELRNRVHIQNLDGHEPACERRAFSDTVVTEGEVLLETVFLFLSKNFPRKHRYTPSVIIPWDHGITI